jgi:hypothetical protein
MASRNLPVGDARSSQVSTWLTLAFTGAALCALCWAFAHTDRTLAMRARMLWLFFGAFAVFLVAVFAAWRARPELPPRLLWFIVIIGVALRLAVAPVRPATTSDIYRYLWEGRVVRAGMNPYADAPDSPRLQRLRDWVWPLVTFRSVPAAYPPVAQYVFAAAGLIPGPPVLVLKLVLALFDVGTVLLLVSILAAMKLPRSWVIIYAWHPLAICELVARGHLDTIGIFFMALAFRLTLVGRPCERGEQRRRLLIAALSGAALALSVLAKGYAIVVTPFLFLAARPRRGLFLVAMSATAALAYAPFTSAGLGLFRGAAMYGRGWQGNASVFALLDLGLSAISPDHDAIARAICLLAMLLWIGLLVKRARAERGLAPACPERLVSHSLGDGGSRRAVSVPVPAPGLARLPLLALIGFFLLSPVVYPWYLAWTLPLLCIGIAAKRRAGDTLLPYVAWLLLTGTIFAFYAHDFAGHHREIWWVTAAEYGLPALVALACLNGDWRRISRRLCEHAPVGHRTCP